MSDACSLSENLTGLAGTGMNFLKLSHPVRAETPPDTGLPGAPEGRRPVIAVIRRGDGIILALMGNDRHGGTELLVLYNRQFWVGIDNRILPCLAPWCALHILSEIQP